MEKEFNIIDNNYLLILTATEEESEALYEICFDLIQYNKEYHQFESISNPLLFHIDVSTIESRYNESITDGYSLEQIKEYIKQNVKISSNTVIILDNTEYEYTFEDFKCPIININSFTQILNPYDEKSREINESQFIPIEGCNIHKNIPEDCLVNKHGMYLKSFTLILNTLDRNSVFYHIPHKQIKRKGFESRANFFLNADIPIIQETNIDIINNTPIPVLGFIDDFTITSYFPCDICEIPLQQFREHNILGYKICEDCFFNNPDLEVIKVDNQILKKEDFIKRFMLDD